LVITYADVGLKIPTTNPILLDSRGEAKVFGSSSYRFVLKDATGVTTLLTTDGVSLSPVAAMTFCDEAGTALDAGKLATYMKGTSYPKTTYNASAVANTNPVIADSNGSMTVYGVTGDVAIKYILKNKDDELIWSLDSAAADPWIKHFDGEGGTDHDNGWEAISYYGTFNVGTSLWMRGAYGLRIRLLNHIPAWNVGYRPTQCRITYATNVSPYTDVLLKDASSNIIGTGLVPNLSTSTTFDLSWTAGEDMYILWMSGIDSVSNIEFYG
jgi:hypothetical protein